MNPIFPVWSILNSFFNTLEWSVKSNDNVTEAQLSFPNVYDKIFYRI